MAQTESDGSMVRLPPFFPRVPKQCKDVAAAFFECFSKGSEYEPGQDPGAGRIALKACAEKLRPYVTCAEQHLTAKQRELQFAPQIYREQARS